MKVVELGHCGNDRRGDGSGCCGVGFFAPNDQSGYCGDWLNDGSCGYFYRVSEPRDMSN